MRWKKSDLRQIHLKDGDWSYTAFFEAVSVAHDWHVKPSELGICPPEDDPAVMAAYTRTMGRMRAKEREEEEARAEKARVKGARKK